MSILLFSLSFSLLIFQISSQSFQSGDFSLRWRDLGDSIAFVFKTSVSSPNNVWSGFALSTDSLMGNDDVVVCKVFGRKTSVERYYTTGKRQPILLDKFNPSIGLSDMSVTINNDEMTCRFTREKYIPGIPNYYDMQRNSYYLLFAKGRTDNLGAIQYHGASKTKSFTLKQF